MTDFWRRWHMTLSRWFRDYVYIPLGGSRGTQAQTVRNLMVVFLLTGAWHGAAWTFVLWGLYNGTLLVVERLSGVAAMGRERREVAPARGDVPARRAGLGAVPRRTALGQAVDFYGAMVPRPRRGPRPARRRRAGASRPRPRSRSGSAWRPSCCRAGSSSAG